jgi:hypothetical protein
MVGATRAATADDFQLPAKATGHVVDASGKPIRGVRVGFSREEIDQETGERSRLRIKRDLSHTLGFAVTDDMGGFSIAFDNSVPTKGPLRAWADHRDYEYWSNNDVQVTQGMEVELTLIRQIALAWKIRDERDPKEAVRMTVDLLRLPDPSRIPSPTLADLYPYLGDMREPLLVIAKSEEYATQSRDGDDETIRHRACRLLAYWADPRDEDSLQRWWKDTTASARAKRLDAVVAEIPRKLRPSTKPGDTLEEAIANWRAAVSMTDKGSYSIDRHQIPDRALVRYQWSPIRSWLYGWDVVFVRRDGKWRPLFQLPTTAFHATFD